MMRHKTLIWAMAAIVQTVAVATIAPSVNAQDTSAGLKLAEQRCARCHAIKPGQIGQHPLAPTFMDIANRYSVWDLQESFAEGILVGHAAMPKFVLKPREINNLLSYMDTMTKRQKQSR